jgi:hypothetical protein
MIRAAGIAAGAKKFPFEQRGDFTRGGIVVGRKTKA